LRHGFVDPHTCTTSIPRVAESCWLSYHTWQYQLLQPRTTCPRGQVHLRSTLNPNDASEAWLMLKTLTQLHTTNNMNSKSLGKVAASCHMLKPTVQ
jgi:hypothetical protein